MKQQISAAVCVNIGLKRENNEDNFYFNGIFLSEKTRDKPAEFVTFCPDKRQFYAVCDGMGGEQLGELASFIAAETLHGCAEILRQNKKKNLDKGIEDYITQANGFIFEAQKTNGASRIGTTLAMLALENKTAHIYNVGDSRVYRFRKNKLEQLSSDHTAVANMVKVGAITPEQAKTHPRRNSLTQYMGINPDEMIIQAYKTSVKIKEKDVFLLCSDGLTDMLEDEEIENILSETVGVSPDESACRLVKKALENGGKDNTTVIILTYNRKLWKTLKSL